MKRAIDVLIFIFIFLFFYLPVFSQPYRKLTLNDFRGVPNRATNEGEVAFTSCSIHYSYSPKKENNYYLLTFSIRLVVNTDQSWIDRSRVKDKKMLEQILNHERGHYNIAYLEQQELLKIVSNTVFYADYGKVANQIFAVLDGRYRKLNIDYDADTQYSTNMAKQHKWDLFFQNKLAGDHTVAVYPDPGRLFRRPLALLFGFSF